MRHATLCNLLGFQILPLFLVPAFLLSPVPTMATPTRLEAENAFVSIEVTSNRPGLDQIVVVGTSFHVTTTNVQGTADSFVCTVRMTSATPYAFTPGNATTQTSTLVIGDTIEASLRNRSASEDMVDVSVTLFRVNWQVANLTENDEESIGFFMRALSCHGSLQAHTQACLSGCKRVTITCEPENRPEGERIQLSYPSGTLLEDTGESLREAYSEYPVQGISRRVFYIACSVPSQQIRDRVFTAQHSVNQCSDISMGTSWNIVLCGQDNIILFREETTSLDVLFQPSEIEPLCRIDVNINPTENGNLRNTHFFSNGSRRATEEVRSESQEDTIPIVASYGLRKVNIQNNIEAEWAGSYLDTVLLNVTAWINGIADEVDEVSWLRWIHLKKMVEPLRDNIVQAASRAISDSITSIPIDTFLDQVRGSLGDIEGIHEETEETNALSQFTINEICNNLRPRLQDVAVNMLDNAFGGPVSSSIQHGLYINEAQTWSIVPTISFRFSQNELKFKLNSGHWYVPSHLPSSIYKWILSIEENGLTDAIQLSNLGAELTITGTSNVSVTGSLSNEMCLKLFLSQTFLDNGQNISGEIEYGLFVLFLCEF